jgi:hypothetical protein
MQELAKQLGTTTWSLGLITSALFVVNCSADHEIDENVKITELEHWNIGLNMKTRSRNDKLILPGYTRYNESTGYEDLNSLNWEFSVKAIEVIKDYMQTFTFVFECLDKFKNLYNRQNKFFKVKLYLT